MNIYIFFCNQSNFFDIVYYFKNKNKILSNQNPFLILKINTSEK